MSGTEENSTPGDYPMTGAELTMMIICYPDIEIKAFDPVTGDYQPISAIEFNAAAEAVELQTFEPIKIKEKP